MKKVFTILSIAFLLLSCNNDGVSTPETTETDDIIETDNPFIGVWMASFIDGSDMVVSHIQFLDKDFYYYVIHINQATGVELSRIIYKGIYNYNTLSKIIFFEIEEPESESGITSSSYQFYEDKLYCYGNKIFITEELHIKTEVSQFI
jgi:hypothetical protein